MWKEVVVTQSWYNSRICLEGLRKSTKVLDQYSQCPSGDSNRTCMEYNSRVSWLQQTWSMQVTEHFVVVVVAAAVFSFGFCCRLVLL
jgi:hypothetical protein